MAMAHIGNWIFYFCHTMNFMGRYLVISIFSVFLLFNISALYGQSYPDGFQVETVADNIEFPAGMVHLNAEVSYVWDLQGYVWPLVNDIRSESPLIDIAEEVGFWNDHGLLSVALDPDFSVNGYIYLYYVVDRHYLMNFGTPQYDANVDEYAEATIGRLTRFQVDISNPSQLLNSDRHIIIGATKETGIPICTTSHGIGTVIFGADKTILLTVGDSNSPGSTYNGVGTPPEGGYEVQALEDGIIKPFENVGAFRSQLLNTYCGKLLRVDKETGKGIPSNPYYDSEQPDEPISKVWSLGLRNPFRMSLIPNTGSAQPEDGNPGEIILGDVGDWTWEEVNLVNGPRLNFGWPIYQGPDAYFHFINNWTSDITRPLTNCDQQPFLYFQDVLVDPRPDHLETWESPCGGPLSTDEYELFVHERPIFTYTNWVMLPTELAVLPGFDSDGNTNYSRIEDLGIEGGMDFYGSASVGGVFYQGAAYPESYYNAYFHADYSRWLKVMHFDDLGVLQKIEHWDDDFGYISHMSLNPYDESLYLTTLFPGEVKRVVFEGNLKPVVTLTPDTVYGVGNQTVDFDASESFDPEGTMLTFAWDFGDGDSGVGEQISHTFSNTTGNPDSFEVILTVTDADGKSSTGNALVSINNSPPLAEISSIPEGYLYPIYQNSYLTLEAELFDAESSIDELEVQWRVFLHHNNHFHLEQTYNTQSAQALVEPLGCGVETYWYRFQLIVTDPQGLQVVKELEIFPDCISENPWPNTFLLYPNPAQYNVILQFPEKGGEWIEIELFDTTGRLVKSLREDLIENQRNLSYSVRGVQDGTYILKAKTVNWESTEKLLILRL